MRIVFFVIILCFARSPEMHEEYLYPESDESQEEMIDENESILYCPESIEDMVLDISIKPMLEPHEELWDLIERDSSLPLYMWDCDSNQKGT